MSYHLKVSKYHHLTRQNQYTCEISPYFLILVAYCHYDQYLKLSFHCYIFLQFDIRSLTSMKYFYALRIIFCIGILLYIILIYFHCYCINLKLFDSTEQCQFLLEIWVHNLSIYQYTYNKLCGCVIEI